MDAGSLQHVFYDNGDVKLGNNNEIFVNSVENKVGIGLNNPSSALEVAGEITASSATINGTISANNMNINGNIKTNTVEASGAISAGSINTLGSVVGNNFSSSGSGSFSAGIQTGGNETLKMDIIPFTININFESSQIIIINHGKGDNIRGFSNPYIPGFGVSVGYIYSSNTQLKIYLYANEGSMYNKTGYIVVYYE
jgi:hypothetical protein